MAKPTPKAIAEQRIIRLDAELKSVSEYYENCLESFESYKELWLMDYAFFLHKCGHDRSAPVAEEVVQPSSNASDGTEVESDISHDDVPPWARKLYKKIAMETHPDRALGTDDIEAKET